MKIACLSCVDSVNNAVETDRHRKGTCVHCGRSVTTNWIIDTPGMNTPSKDDCEEISHGFLNLGLQPYRTKRDPESKRKRLFLAFYPHREAGQQEVLYCLSFSNYVLSIETAPASRAGSYEGHALTDEHAIYCVRELIVGFMNGRILEEIDVDD